MVFKHFNAKIMYKPYIPNENLIFPPNLGDFIPEDAPVRLISEIVGQLDIKDVHDSYSKSPDGQPPYNPVMLLKVVLFGYMSNIYSTRGLEEAMHRDAHLIWLSSYQFPDHSTISRFKTRCMPFIKKIFASLVTVLVDRGEIKLSSDLYIDGTTIRSRAARRRIKWRGSHERFSASADEAVQEAVIGLLDQIENGDADDDNGQQGHVGKYTVEDARRIADEIEKRTREEGLRKTRGKISAIRDACDRKEAHDKVVEQCGGRCGIAPSDPDCGIMHAKEDGYDGRATPNYNVQAATQNQYVTNFDVYDTPSDKDTAVDFVDLCIEENGVRPQAVVEDAGYGCEEVYVELEKRSIEAVVKYPGYDKAASRRPVKDGEYDRFNWRLSEDRCSVICPAGKRLRVVSTEVQVSKRGFRSDVTHMTCDDCQGCPFINDCQLQRNKDRLIGRKLGNMREEEKAFGRLSTPRNQARLRRRTLEPEPVFGQLKHNHGYTRFRHFGKSKVRMDLGFELMALNILKLYRNTKKSA
ncbi:IS1182 family transposase [uncultured Duncaniella sp.]|nr:IS1182 family transposase [uncultured Duncaniella sp.]